MRRIPVGAFLTSTLVLTVLVGCSTGASAPLAPESPGENGQGNVETELVAYEGEWEIYALALASTDPEELLFTCPGSVTLATATSASDEMEVLDGTYVVLAEQDCSVGSTMSGSLLDIDLRPDGGIDFGLDVPGSDGNIFEDFLVGAGLVFESVKPFGCSDPQPAGPPGDAKDEVNHLNGTLLDDRLRAAASASMRCPGIPEDDIIVQVRIVIDLTRAQ